jgi:1,2-diacylglycerol 3-alpha-glucosyltransferase
VRVVPTGIPEFKIPKVSKEKLKKRYDLPGGKKILLSVSRLSKEKNVKLLLRTLKILPDNYHLLLVGTGPDEESLKELAGKLGVSGRVTFLGKINHDKVPEVYLSSDIFVFPSLIETQGLTLLEAAYFGMPIVAVDTDICREWIHQGGVVVKDEIMSFANGVKKLEKMDKGKIRAQAKKFANNFTNDAIVKEIISLYQEVIDNERKPSLKGKLKNKLETLDKYMKKAI